jgi:hypothetical protein
MSMLDSVLALGVLSGCTSTDSLVETLATTAD